ncbi:flagellar hook-basal body complex protein FliE [Marinicauda salina]|uniref:Flagellar hook-basal body complex protein FliE n=1 Tax=Marinicauda salina TaxID=2135793 RepID=A0A2U2BU55_9PROT|nr:flagellar hook-basal body complex protein FliE [Marinicauda salina]PWE17543.1 flagellar hook-basal body complex protein FliE [Marinicauda salina]
MDPAALRAYAAAQQAAASAASGGQDAAAPSGADFGALVNDAVQNTESSLQAAETLTAQAAVGQAELVDVVTAVSAAETQLETVIAVRDQVIRAYQDILKMPI